MGSSFIGRSWTKRSPCSEYVNVMSAYVGRLIHSNSLKLVHALEQTEWNERFANAQSQDHALLERLNEQQAQMNETVQNLQRVCPHDVIGRTIYQETDGSS